MSDRGEYRVWYVNIVDDPDFQEMPGDVFKVLFALKMSLGAAGIGVIHRLMLSERIGCTVEKLEESLTFLSQPKPDRALGWIVRDRNIVWVVNALRNERGLSPHSYHHRQFIEKQLKPLGDKQIVKDFRAYYAAWFEISCPLPHTIEGAEKGSAGGLEGGSDHYNQEPRTENPEPGTEIADVARATTPTELSRLLITRLNQGMLDNPAIGKRYNPVPHHHGHSLAAAEAIFGAEVDPEFASSFVYTAATKYKPAGRNRQINSLSYLADGLITEWERHRAHLNASGTSRPAARQSTSRSRQSPMERSLAASAAALGDEHD